MAINIVFGVLFFAIATTCWFLQPDNYTAFVVALFAASYHFSAAEAKD